MIKFSKTRNKPFLSKGSSSDLVGSGGVFEVGLGIPGNGCCDACRRGQLQFGCEQSPIGGLVLDEIGKNPKTK